MIRLRKVILLVFIISLALWWSTVALAEDAIIVAFRGVDFIEQGGGEVRFPTDRQYPTFLTGITVVIGWNGKSRCQKLVCIYL